MMYKVKIRNCNGCQWIQLPRELVFDDNSELDLVQIGGRLEIGETKPDWLSLTEETQIDEQWLLERSLVFDSEEWGR